MLSLAVLCILVVAEIRAAYVPLPASHTDSHLKECRNETGFTDELLNKMKKNPYTEDGGEDFRKFTKCYLERTDFVTSDGKLNVADALAKLGPNFAKQIFENCRTHVQKDGEKFVVVNTETTSDYSECFRQGVLNDIWNAEKEGFEPFTSMWQS